MYVVYVSSATDIRSTESLLRASGQEYRVEALGMGSAAQRERFRQMKHEHEWSSLPMIFDGEQFIGGEPELSKRLASPATKSASDNRRDGVALARVLGIGGLIPFVALGAAALLDTALAGFAPRPLLLAYAATIRRFVGAVHWGMCISGDSDTPRRRLFAASVIPALWAWLALALPGALAPAAFVVGFAGWYLWERYTVWHLYPAWFQSLRTLLTSVVCAVLALVATL